MALATVVLHGPACQHVPRCFRQLRGSCAANKAVCTPSPLRTWPELCPDASVPAMVLVPGCCPSPCPRAVRGWLPFTWCQGQRGNPCPKHFTAGPPSSLPALTMPLGKPCLGFLLSRFKDFTFMSPGCTYCGSQYFWTAGVCAVLTGEARQGKARQENDSLLSYVTLMSRSKSKK